MDLIVKLTSNQISSYVCLISRFQQLLSQKSYRSKKEHYIKRYITKAIEQSSKFTKNITKSRQKNFAEF